MFDTSNLESMNRARKLNPWRRDVIPTIQRLSAAVSPDAAWYLDRFAAGAGVTATAADLVRALHAIGPTDPAAASTLWGLLLDSTLWYARGDFAAEWWQLD